MVDKKLERRVVNGAEIGFEGCVIVIHDCFPIGLALSGGVGAHCIYCTADYQDVCMADYV